MFIVHSFLGLLLRIFGGSGDTRFRFNESPNHHQNSPRDSDLGIQASAVTGGSSPGGRNGHRCYRISDTVGGICFLVPWREYYYIYYIYNSR